MSCARITTALICCRSPLPLGETESIECGFEFIEGRVAPPFLADVAINLAVGIGETDNARILYDIIIVVRP